MSPARLVPGPTSASLAAGMVMGHHHVWVIFLLRQTVAFSLHQG